jgi:nucleoid-associated protein YgaU
MSALALTAIVAGTAGLAWLLWPRSGSAEPRRPEGQERGPVAPRPKPIEVGIRPIPDPPAASIPPPGGSPGDPAYSPAPGVYYQVQRGDTGVGIAARAYGLPRGAGAPYRAWLRIRSRARNRVLSPDGVSLWDGRLVARHDGHAPRGSGSRFPVVWLPEVV